jgi:nucleosome binding factor SPN SPT16 subunit
VSIPFYQDGANLTIIYIPLLTNLRPYSLHIADTVKVGQERGVCLTDVARESKDCLFFIDQEEDEPKQKQKPKPPKASPQKTANNKVAGNKVLRTQTRSAGGAEVMQTTRTKIYPHQKELHAKRQAEGLARFENGAGGAAGGEEKTWKRFISYKGEAALPPEVNEPKVNKFLQVNLLLADIILDLY